MKPDEEKNKSEIEIEQFMEQRLRENFETSKTNVQVSDERMKEMNKKLPSWSLEPPYSFLK